MVAMRSMGILLGLMALTFIGACGDGKSVDKSAARDQAKQFFNAVLDDDIKTIITLVDYPFRLDDKGTFDDEVSLKKALKKNRSSMRQASRDLNQLEIVTYEEFISGKPIQGKSFTKEQATRKAKSYGLREGGVIVRVHHLNEETKLEDARFYFLFMHPDVVGDLKITGYLD